MFGSSAVHGSPRFGGIAQSERPRISRIRSPEEWLVCWHHIGVSATFYIKP